MVNLYVFYKVFTFFFVGHFELFMYCINNVGCFVFLVETNFHQLCDTLDLIDYFMSSVNKINNVIFYLC